MSGDPPQPSKKPNHPSRGVHIQLDQPTIVFLNLCTKNRTKLLANDQVHTLLRQVWMESTSWLTGYYLIMPDHIHLFASPRDLSVKFDDWITYWEAEFRRRHKYSKIHWQSNPFHHRLRTHDSYIEKLNYSRQNPVEAGLVTNPDDWPFQGPLNHIRWD